MKFTYKTKQDFCRGFVRDVNKNKLDIDFDAKALKKAILSHYGFYKFDSPLTIDLIENRLEVAHVDSQDIWVGNCVIQETTAKLQIIRLIQEATYPLSYCEVEYEGIRVAFSNDNKGGFCLPFPLSKHKTSKYIILKPDLITSASLTSRELKINSPLVHKSHHGHGITLKITVWEDTLSRLWPKTSDALNSPKDAIKGLLTNLWEYLREHGDEGCITASLYYSVL